MMKEFHDLKNLFRTRIHRSMFSFFPSRKLLESKRWRLRMDKFLFLIDYGSAADLWNDLTMNSSCLLRLFRDNGQPFHFTCRRRNQRVNDCDRSLPRIEYTASRNREFVNRLGRWWLAMKLLWQNFTTSPEEFSTAWMACAPELG